MAIDGIVTQTHSGQVQHCTLASRCFKENGSVPKGKERTCLLSVNHGDRCTAWETDLTKWLIDADPSKIKQLP
jgi:hypothetical protein